MVATIATTFLMHYHHGYKTSNVMTINPIWIDQKKSGLLYNLTIAIINLILLTSLTSGSLTDGDNITLCTLHSVLICIKF